jgi:hypothetical protein
MYLLLAKTAPGVLAPTSLTARSMRKYPPQTPRFRIHAQGELSAAPSRRQQASPLSRIQPRSDAVVADCGLTWTLP